MSIVDVSEFCMAKEDIKGKSKNEIRRMYRENVSGYSPVEMAYRQYFISHPSIPVSFEKYKSVFEKWHKVFSLK